MKLKLAAVTLISSLALTGLIYVASNGLMSSQPANCTAILKSRYLHGQSAVMPNSDGGLFVLTGSEGSVLFTGFVGPKTALSLKNDMLDQGLIQVNVETEGQCVTDSGVIFTLVSGQYSIPQQPEADPI